MLRIQWIKETPWRLQCNGIIGEATIKGAMDSHLSSFLPIYLPTYLSCIIIIYLITGCNMFHEVYKLGATVSKSGGLLAAIVDVLEKGIHSSGKPQEEIFVTVNM